MPISQHEVGILTLLAAQLGCPKSVYRLAKIYRSNGDVRGWLVNLKKAAALGVPEAQCSLGVALVAGNEVEKRQPRMGFAWMWRAAEKFVPEALFAIGICCWHGVGTPRDRDKGFLFMQTAAKQHYSMAYLVLAKMCLTKSTLQVANQWLDKVKEVGVDALARCIGEHHVLGESPPVVSLK